MTIQKGDATPRSTAEDTGILQTQGGGMRTPNTGSEVTEVWVQHMLTCYERRRDPQASVRVLNYRVRAGTKPGENVGSELVKIWAEVELTGRREEKEEDKEENVKVEEEEKEKKDTKNLEKKVEEQEKEEKDQEKEKEKLESKSKENDTKSKKKSHSTTATTTTKKEYHLVAKFNEGTEFDHQFHKYMNFDLNELLIYSDVIPHLNAWQEQVLREKGEEGEALDRYKVQVPEFVYGVCTYDEYVLVMQDVSVMGYATEDKMQGLDLPHVLMAADRLARLHAASHAFHQTHDFLRHYPSFETDQRMVTFFVEFMFMTVNFALEMASQRPEFAPIVKKMRENQEAMKARLIAAMMRGNPENRVVCLVHGDYWTNNLMYSHEGEGKTPKDLMLIDWGILSWRNPMIDLHQLLSNCTTRSFRQQHLQDVLQRYHSTFTAATTALGAQVHGYDFDAFLIEWRRTAICGFLQSGLFANAIVLSRKASEVFKKGTPSYGLKGMALGLMGRVMAPLILRGWFREKFVSSSRERFQPLLEEMLSGENHVLNTRLLELMEEAYEEGVMDE